MTGLATRAVQLLIILTVSVSVLNVAQYARKVYHPAFFQDSRTTQRDEIFSRARAVLENRGARHAAYMTENLGSEASAAQREESLGEFFAAQYAMVPVVLRRDFGEEQYVLVNFWKSKTLPELPGMTLIEEYGEGIALYRRR